MDAAHVHLVFNHFPILGTLFGLLILATGLIIKQKAVIYTGLAVFIFTAIMSIPAYFSGEEAEHIVEDLPGVSHDLIEEHEEIAKFGFIMVEALGILSIFSLVLSVKVSRYGKLATLITVVLSALVFALMIQVGNTGGQIQHPEISTAKAHNDYEHDD